MAKKKERTTTEQTEMGATSGQASSAQTPESINPLEVQKPKRTRTKKSDAPLAEMGIMDTAAAPETVVTVENAQTATSTAKGRSKKAIDTSSESIKPAKPGRAKKIALVPAVENIPTGPEQPVYYNAGHITDFDIHLFREGRHYTLYEKLGSHVISHQGRQGTFFAVWAPNAAQVSVIGDFNGWNRESHQLQARPDHSGIWEGFIPGVAAGMLYKYHIKSSYHLYHVEKSDPFAFQRELPPHTASIVADINHNWQDESWLSQRSAQQAEPQPYSVYELHVGSWRRKPEEGNRSLTYRELAQELPAYLKEMGFTHVEFMPIMYHPFNGSWGYQITGYFAAASNFGTPEDLMYLIDVLHQHGIGVLLDWVPSHFPSDEHGLAYFDGTHLFEHADPRKGYHPDWNSYIFNYGRNEVRSFLISNALFWLDKYHIDGLRVDAVASMLYLDYSRKHDEWVPNEHGGRENLEAISFLKDFNEAVHTRFPDVRTIAEESTAWPGVTAKVADGGLGFDMKWMMGWMHDTLHYFSRESIYRRYHQGEITFSIIYAFAERFMLPLSHDEVVHGKGSLINKMPGDDWQKFANLRTLYTYMYAHPGAKLLFMGNELAQGREWNHDSSLDWHLLDQLPHAGMKELVKELNHVYKNEPSLYFHGFEGQGFEWIDFNDSHNSIISFMRNGQNGSEKMLVVCNFTPAVYDHYRIGVPLAGNWAQVFNSDDGRFGGSNYAANGTLHTVAEPMHGRDFSLEIKMPPLAVLYFKYLP
ncbi:1,4-alpha-glucan branching protein GlgB [Pontibacter arcticus]|uniref:1,4-alpha-glucan branching enzyme GlgB n=1 Tax=Pontibacter arcticus TaxID=2080288 RepID=A0A364REK0_9BACT|nr:1,4-alpha-glucan branching protein GlgB [Pontibacter arcticus]RAU82702.1 1,4-alpha-glucan branching protein GlgB [Pontibacter arcticus]